MKFADHPWDVHHDTPGTEDGKVRAKPERDDRFSRALPDQPVVHLARRLTRRREREPVGEKLHIEHEEMSAVREHPALDMRHDGLHLFFNRPVRLFNKQVDELLVASGVPAKVQDILDDLSPVAEPEPELFVVERQRNIAAIILRVLGCCQFEVARTLRRFAPVPDPRDRRQVPDLVLDRRVDQARDLGPQHPGRNAVIPAHMVGVHVADQVLVHRLIRVMVIHDHHREVVYPGHLQRRNILISGPVIHQEDHRHLLPVTGVILEGEVQIPRDILNLVKRGFGRRPLEEEVLCVKVPAALPEQRGHRLLDGDGGAYAVRISMVSEDNRPRGQDGFPDLLRDLTHLRPEGLENLTLDKEREFGRFRTLIQCHVDTPPDPCRILRFQDRHRCDLDLQLVVALHHLTREADNISEFNLRIRTDTRLDERRCVPGA